MRSIGLVWVILAVFASHARADGSLFDSLGKSMGLIAEPANPPDFVKASRPKAEPTEIPVFATPEEPRSTVKSPAQLKAMGADLESASRSHATGAPKPRKPKAP